MINIIHKIYSDKIDEEVHADFVKFSRGIFENRYLIEGKKQKDKWAIKTSGEFANFFVRRLLENTKENLNIKGIIVSTSDIEKDCIFPIEDVKRYMGIKQIIINCEISPQKILDLMSKYPRAFYALSFSTNDSELKIKPKAPKSAKPGNSTKNGDEGPKADFCSLKTSDKEIVKDLFFDIEKFPELTSRLPESSTEQKLSGFPEFNEIKIKHIIEIKEIELPKDVVNPVEIREKAVRKGVLKRIVNVDGKKEIKEKEFVV